MTATGAGMRWVRRGGLWMGVVLAVWASYWLVSGSTRAAQREHEQAIAELDARIAEMRRRIESVKETEQRAVAARASLDRWRAERPAGGTVMWVPEVIGRHFRELGVTGETVRLSMAAEDKAVRGIQRSDWTVEVPLGSGPGALRPVLLALAEIERREPHVRVERVAVREGAGDPSARVLVVGLGVVAPL